MKETLKVSMSGIRGVIGDSFTPQLAASFAQAFGTFIGRGTILVGRDTRPSGTMIEQAVIAGLQSVGCKPVLIGIVPTPTLLVLTKELGARGGIAITASHNPAAWNALKFIERTGLFLDDIRSEELFDIYHQQDFPLVHESEIKPVSTETRAMDVHFDKILSYVNAAAIRQRKLKVAVDCCNGVGALFSVSFLRDKLGCDVISIFDQPTGFFEREPEPLPQNITALGKTVREHGCDVGFAQDPDGDRLAVVDETGTPIGEDLTLALAVQQVLDAHEHGPVAINLSTGKAVDFVARRRDCEVIRTKIGETNVTEVMLKIGAVVGGENTGGIIIPQIHPCRDSFAGMAIILEFLAQSGKKVSELVGSIPRYAILRDKIPVHADQIPSALRYIRQHYSHYPISLMDGIHVDQGEGWFHVRPSNTESVLRLVVEANTEDAARKQMDQLRKQIKEIL